jgi:hypothetical protein
MNCIGSCINQSTNKPTNHNPMKTILYLSIFVLLCANTAFAQSRKTLKSKKVEAASDVFMQIETAADSTAAPYIYGVVKDDKGEPLFAANVILILDIDKVISTAETDFEGAFDLRNLKFNQKIRIKCTYSGMKDVISADIVLKKGAQYKVEFFMKDDIVSDCTIIRSTNIRTIDFYDMTTHTIYSGEQVRAMPVK